MQHHESIAIADHNDRAENFILDFIISSAPALLAAYFVPGNMIAKISAYYFVRFLYYFLFEITCRQTPGKLQTQTKIIGNNQQKPTTKAIFIRNIFRFVSLLSAVSDEQKAIHDKLSGTEVVKDLNLKKVYVRIIVIRSLILLIAAYIIFHIIAIGKIKLSYMPALLFLGISFYRVGKR